MSNHTQEQLFVLAVMLVGYWFIFLGCFWAFGYQKVWTEWTKQAFGWIGRTFVSGPIRALGRSARRQALRFLRWVNGQFQRFVRWTFRELWRLVRQGSAALYRAAASLL